MNNSMRIDVPANSRQTKRQISDISIVDDRVNEEEESFAVVAEMKQLKDSCFRENDNISDCLHDGWFEIIVITITDNDRKLCYFLHYVLFNTYFL